MNVVIIQGVVIGEPDRRVLADGSERVSFDVSTGEPGARATAPVVCMSSQAGGVADGAAITVIGSVRRRFFRVGASTQSRTEVVADEVIESRRTASARRAIERSLATLPTRLAAEKVRR